MQINGVCEIQIHVYLILFVQYTSEHHQYTVVSQHWDALKQSAGTEHSVGENTRKFWDTCPNKFAVSLKYSGSAIF